MENPLIAHIVKTINISAFEKQCIIKAFKSGTFRKKQNLLEEGQSCKYLFFVCKGCLRMFFINDKGAEQTIQFALENWWMTDNMAFETGKYAAFSIQAIEQTEVLYIDK